MNDDEAIAFLTHGTRTGKLATSSASGVPHVAPIWFVADGRDLVFTTWHESVKGRQLRANPIAALCVDDETYPYGFVVVRGPVTIAESASDLQHWATKIAERYVPAGRAEEYGRRNAVEGELLCRLRLERVTGATEIAL
ncbi:MAG TPA: PPOX class F420-dependent oxidoreductase [Actinocrinis sp.]|nr:PPOX class F420-dependent oxidoreductase [Actinocrinis sp.]